MKKFMKKCKRVLVLVLTIALVGNSVDLSMLHVRAQELSEFASQVGDENAQNQDAQNVHTDDLQDTVSDGNAQSSVSAGEELFIEYVPDPVVFPEAETSALSRGFFSLRNGVVDKISGNAVKWIDRLDLSGDEYQFAKDLYNNLIEWTDNDGTDDYLIDDSYHAGNDLKVAVASVTKSYNGSDYTQATLDVMMDEAYTEVGYYSLYMRAVYEAFDRDHPEVFWLSGGTAYSYNGSYHASSNSLTFTATIYLMLDGTLVYENASPEEFDMRKEMYQSQSAVEAGIAIRDNAVATILTDEVKAMSVVEQIEYFNDKLTKSNEYNTIIAGTAADLTVEPSDDCWECITALTGKTGTEGPVCEAYARAFKVLCDEVGIPCVLVDGYARNSLNSSGEAHMWNYVQVDGNWYGVDATWNDPTGGASGAVSGYENERWLLVGSDTVISGMSFIDSHPVSNKLSSNGVSFTNGPILSTTEYDDSVASVTDSNNVTKGYATIEEAFAAAQNADGGEITLLKSVEARGTIRISTDGSYKLNLNNNTLDMGTGYLLVNKGELTICDESSEKNGQMTTDGSQTLYVNLGTTVKMTGGTIVPGSLCAVRNAGTFEMTGGTISASATASYGIYHEQQNLVIGGEATIYGGALASVIIYKGDVTISGGTFSGSKYGLSTADNFGDISLKISGNPVINGSSAGCDISLGIGDVITLTGALNGTDTYSVKISETTGVFAKGADENGNAYVITSADEGKFIATNDVVEVVAKDNTLSLDYRTGDIPISITWEDEDNRYDTRPEYMQIEVYANDGLVDTIYLEATESWLYTLEDMPFYDEGGEITYDMILKDDSGKYVGSYDSSEDGFVWIASLKHKHDLQLIYDEIDGEEQYDFVEIICAEEEGDCDWLNSMYFVTVNGPMEDPLFYDGQAKQVEVFDNMTSEIPWASVSEIAYYKKDGTRWVAVEEAVEAGVYKAEVTVSLDGNTKAAWLEFEIMKQPSENLIVVYSFDGTFAPLSQDGVKAVEVELLQDGLDAVIEYSTDGGSTWSTTVPMMKNVGSLDVTVRVSTPDYETYEETVTACMAPYDISGLYVEFAEERYYYTGEEVEPLVEGVYNDMKERLPLTPADYTLTYVNNVECGTASICLTPINANYSGEIVQNFGIGYYDVPINILYNGSDINEDWYRDDVIVSAEGYTIKRVVDNDFTPSITITREGMEAVRVQFKQNGTGYITSEMNIWVNIDRAAPSFEAEDAGIYLNEYSWQTLATQITYDVIYEEEDVLEFEPDDNLSVLVEVYYYVDTTGSNTALTKTELDELRNTGKFELSESHFLTLNNDGKYVVYAYGVDEAGNVSDYVSTNGIVVDTTAPGVEVEEPTKEAGTLKDTEMTFTVSVDEDAMIGIYMITDYTGESVGQVIYDDDYGYWESMEPDEQLQYEDEEMADISYKVFVNAGETKTITITDLRPGTFYEYSVEVYDKAENGTVCGGGEVEDEPGAYYMKGITTLKTTPVFSSNPTITGTYGQKLSEMILSQPASTNEVPGSWSIVYADDSQKDQILKVGTNDVYQVKFTPSGENAECYESVTVQVVPTVAKKAVTARIDNAVITYGDDLPGFSCVTDGLLQNDTLTFIFSTTAVKGSNAGTYTITGSCDSANYDVTIVNGILTITQADAAIALENSKDTYTKTFGDDSFVLSGISTNSDGKLSYSVADDDVVSVDANGKVTINGVGSAVITVSVAATNNYKAAEAVEITVDVAKATVAGAAVSKSYLYLKESQEIIDLTGYLPTDAGNVAYQVGAVSGTCEFSVTPVVVNGKLSYTVKAGEIDDSSSVAVTVSSDNYESFEIKVTVTLVDQTPVVEREGSEVSLKNNTLTYGEALSKLEFNEAVFVAEGTGEVVIGKLTWETPELTPNVATTKATWVFTPDSNEYMEATGEVAIVVKKAAQPEFSIVALGEMEYFPGGAERTPIETVGGLANGNVTITVPADNGVIRLDSDNCFTMLGAGTVTITAVCVDSAGNYEDAEATYELTILPYELDESQIRWETGVSGAETYDGTAKEPAVWMYMISGPLTEGTDYIVEYVNNTNTYTLAESDVGFDASKAPAVVVTGKGNYAGTVKKYFVINKAETEITVADGKDSYIKTFGDDSFVLSGISTNSDGKLSYSVADDDVVSVDANGKVTINGAGSAVITVSVEETDNYKAAEAVEITVNVAKETVAGAAVSKSYLYLKESQEIIDLTGYLPTDAGNVAYQVGAVSGTCEFSVAPVVVNGKLSYTVKAGEIDDSSSVAVTVSSDNYESFEIKVTVTLVDQTLVVEREGSEVSLKNNTLTYGEALSKLEFNEAVFVAEGTGEVVTGTLAWESPELTPNVATTKATWVFTPDSNEYMEATGEVAIVVKKAAQPAFNIAALGDVEYAPGKVFTVTTTGGVAGGKVTLSVPASNGVIEVSADGTAKVLSAGTVTITAVKVDVAGNYEDATATYELTVAPAGLKAEQVAWATGFNGEKTYTGQVQEADATVTVAGMTLVEGTDYTITYVNNTNAYTLDESDAGFDESKAPAVVVTGKGNYAGTVKKYFVINKADSAITVENGKDAYTKTYGDDSFVLDGITKSGEAMLTYTVANSKDAAGQTVAQDKVVTVDAAGKVTVVGAGTAQIVVSMAETSNYKAATDVTITVLVEQAAYEADAVEKNYAYNKDNSDTIDLAAMVPTDAGKVSYQVQGITGNITFANAATVDAAGKLTYTLSSGTKGQSSVIRVLVSSENYKDFVITVELGLPYEILVVLKSGSEVAVTGSLTYGEALSKLKLNEAVFVEEGTDNVVSGTLTWVDADSIPEVANTTAQWIFTPDNKDYGTVTGTTAIVVEKAQQPELEIVVARPVIYGQSGILEVSGGLSSSKLTLTTPENNGIIGYITEENAGSYEVTAVKVGTVTITAEAKDTTGNYKDATVTYELTVAPAEIEAEWLSWADGFNGEVTYTGEAFVPVVTVNDGVSTLVQGQDYTVEYEYNKQAYTLKEGDADFDASKAPKAVVIGKGNYTGEVILCFVINKAENAPNMPNDTRIVASNIETAGQVSLSDDWAWQDDKQTLAEGAATIAIAVYAGADKGNYINETVAVTITRLEEGVPFVAEINGEEVDVVENGWEHIRDDLSEAEDGDVITVDMNGATVLPGYVIDDIKGQDIVVVLDMSNGVTWTIHGEDITADTIGDVDLQVALDTTNISLDVVNKVAGTNYCMQISLAHDGEFGYTATLTINLKAENAGYYAQLFHYEEAEKVLEFITEKLIDAEGYVALPFTHASDYAIVINEEAYEVPGSNSGSGNNGGGSTPAPTPTPTPVPTPVPTPSPAPVAPIVPASPETGDTFPMADVILFMAACMAVALGTNYGRRKRLDK